MAEEQKQEPKIITNKLNFPTLKGQGEGGGDSGAGGENNKPDPKKKDEGGEFVADIKLEGDNGGGEKPKLNFARYKDYIGEEVADEETFATKLSEKFKEKDSKISKLEVLAQSRSKLNEDKEYQGYAAWLKESPENLVTAQLMDNYISDGMTKDAALAKAKEKVKKELEKDADWASDSARGIKASLKGLMAERETAVAKEIEDATKEIQFTNPNTEFEGKAKESLSKREDFLGMKLPKDEKERTKLLNAAFIEPKKLAEMLKDPETYAKVSLLLKYEKQWTDNIASRTNGKAKVLEKLPAARSLNGLTNKAAKSSGGERKAFSQEGFLGRK